MEGACLFIVPLALVALVIVHGRAVRTAHARSMQALADRLETGRVTGPTGWLTDPFAVGAEGRLDGIDVRVHLLSQNDPAQLASPTVRYEVLVPNAAAPFVVERRGVADTVVGWLGAGDPDAAGFMVRRGADVARRLVQADAAREALQSVMGLEGVDRVELRTDGALRVEQRTGGFAAAYDLASLERSLATIVKLARRCARMTITVRERPAARFAWTDGGATPRCPYCRDDLDPAAAVAAACGRCGTVHHAGCLEEAGGCTVFGCGERGARAWA